MYLKINVLIYNHPVKVFILKSIIFASENLKKCVCSYEKY
jgi:hypothetical protein